MPRPDRTKLGPTVRITHSSLINFLVIAGFGLLVYKFARTRILDLPLWQESPVVASRNLFEEKCLKFRPQLLNSKLEVIEYLEAGNRASLKHRDLTCGGPAESQAVSQDICRIALYVETSAISGIHLEAWIPRSWNSRFLGIGNGGLNGCLDYASLVYGTSHGFVALASNNGHNGTKGLPFYDNPEVLHDFADRAIHVSALAGKAITRQFHGVEDFNSYFLGCSQGGRQGIANAMKFPNDYDGVVAGAPALDFNSLVSWRASFYPLTGSDDSSEFISSKKWSNLIHDEVLRQCDDLDGVRDGIIEYPDLCDFKPEVLLCKPDTPDVNLCLSTAQVKQVQQIFSPYTHSDGSLIYPGMQVGSEQQAVDRLYSGKPFTDSEDWFKYVVHADPQWDPAMYTTDDARKAQKLNPFDIRTYPSHHDLIEFRKKGGKLLVYHGMQDQQITGHNTARWFDYMQSQGASMDDLDEWARYFRISGLLHCSGGPGAWMVGQTGGSVGFEPKKNVLAAIVSWVEEGAAPEELEGTKLFEGLPFGGGGSPRVEFTRRHCRYPKRNRYVGPSLERRARHNIQNNAPRSSVATEWICV
ncbi:uncharacterized protein PV09_08947 [Verruconis gallopava]|uniref:Carboxylic ester hydrolase n=1 Tax=Verruconis gallopava TaxID=253628 RepID=A0A0D2AKA5_9PEZI|nr:uncharacterized protein PV09_08947 [Verruconis gallopava]KIV99408.1 hypothetical protein PV09_08947 [Verruconis gallopava]